MFQRIAKILNYPKDKSNSKAPKAFPKLIVRALKINEGNPLPDSKNINILKDCVLDECQIRKIVRKKCC
jgi:hypothetical protein